MNHFNPLAYIPVVVRVILYIVYGLGGLVLIYLQQKGIVGGDELTLYVGIGTFLGLTAASNITFPAKEERAAEGHRYSPPNDPHLFD